ncbi:MAG: chromosome segregation protein SMC [Saccharofermentanales bacterium]
MHLKTLEIQGFKSFPEKTIIEFNKGVTAIVGPNGSGKSNVTDAIRWVLGEQSIKTLRGSKMEDVIFTGTQSRRAMGYAEVNMIIDNDDRKIMTDYTEIQITRRLYRSGESEYFINKTACRLKDVITLFMDTGLGRDGYSIVGQGRVDEILSHKSEDRRKVFEEAAGIVKFKIRKEEAEHKLNNTQQNMLRVNDIILELENQIGPLQEQSQVAHQYLLYRDELKSIEIALFLDNIDKYAQKLNEYQEEYDNILIEVNKETRFLEDMKEKNREFTEETKLIEDQIEEKRNALQILSDKTKDIQTKIQMNNERISQININLEAGAQEESQIEESIRKIESELQTRQKKEEYLNSQLKQYAAKLTEYESRMKAIVGTLNETEKKAEGIKVRIDELVESLYDKKSQAQETRGQTKMIDSREKTISFDIASLISEQDSLSIKKEECETLISEINRKHNEISAKLDADRAELDEIKSFCTRISTQVESKKLDFENKKYRIKTLVELEKSKEGYSDTVKAILSKVSGDDTLEKKVFGTLGDLVEVSEKYETAIEIALGNSVQNIVTDNEQTASSLIDYLKQNRLGRATFLPISSITGRVLESEYAKGARSMQGYIGIANELITVPDNIRGIADNLLGRIVVVDKLPDAIAIARKYRYSFKIVTLEGDVVNPGGSLTGGYQRSRGTGILGRPREIARLMQENDAAQEEIAGLQAQLPEAQARLTQKAREILSLEQQLTNNSHEKIREDSRLSQIVSDITRCAGRIGMLKAEQEQLKKQRIQIDSEAKSLDQESQMMESEVNLKKSELEQIEISSKDEQEKRDELRDMISDLKLSVNSIEESINSAKELSSRIIEEKSLHLRNMKKREEDRQKSVQDIDSLNKQSASLEEELQVQTVSRDEVNSDIETLAAKRKELEDQASTFYDRFEKATQRIAELQNEIGKSEVKKERMEAGLDEVKNKLWEQYELTYDNAQKWRAKIDSAASAQRKVNELKASIKELGDININSIEEYAKVSERYEFMKVQRDDIELSRKKLLVMIGEIVEEMQKQFLLHFEIINENFKTVFSELFGGGMAEIILDNTDDVLGCNIDIHAQPPGKKLQNMLLLSGGERCLTAIALLFSILKLRPSPFCVLDEIEAALDDANVLRFTEYIKFYADKSQFILVTHHKGTMEAADMIYGVTMQERGISKILSMRLTE